MPSLTNLVVTRFSCCFSIWSRSLEGRHTCQSSGSVAMSMLLLNCPMPITLCHCHNLVGQKGLHDPLSIQAKRTAITKCTVRDETVSGSIGNCSFLVGMRNFGGWKGHIRSTRIGCFGFWPSQYRCFHIVGIVLMTDEGTSLKFCIF